jgi:hypothetical protein
VNARPHRPCPLLDRLRPLEIARASFG